ncbi:MAG TPA: trigger factor [Fimbriimonadaceae bacterium]|nr:trigger factor [Fimbriimonadaceae bacterium]
MTVTREDLNPCTVKLSIVCEPAEVKEGFDKAYRQISKKIRLPGFRPGHAPRAMVEPLLDKNDLYNEAADQIVRKLGSKSIEDEKLQPDPSQRPMVELSKLDADKGECDFTVKVALPPIVDLGEYKGLPVEKPGIDVTDEEVDYQIEELRKRRSTREAITDRGTAEGDVAVVNVKVIGEEGEGRTFMTVVGQTFPELDQALVGMKVEEMKNLELTFPDSFQDKDWAGKKLSCVVTVNTLSAVKLPQLDEAFARQMKSDNVEELRAKMRETIAHAKEEMVKEIVNEQLLDALLERSTVHVSDNMWENLAARRLQETAEDQHKQGRSLEDYAKENGMTLEELVDNWKDKARIHVKRALAIREVFTKEKMTLNNQELNQELFAMAQEYEINPEDLLNILKKNNQIEELHFRAIARKVGDFLIEHADAKEVVKA